MRADLYTNCNFILSFTHAFIFLINTFNLASRKYIIMKSVYSSVGYCPKKCDILGRIYVDGANRLERVRGIIA